MASPQVAAERPQACCRCLGASEAPKGRWRPFVGDPGAALCGAETWQRDLQKPPRLRVPFFPLKPRPWAGALGWPRPVGPPPGQEKTFTGGAVKTPPVQGKTLEVRLAPSWPIATSGAATARPDGQHAGLAAGGRRWTGAAGRGPAGRISPLGRQFVADNAAPELLVEWSHAFRHWTSKVKVGSWSELDGGLLVLNSYNRGQD
jgi:hypothetical protein